MSAAIQLMNSFPTSLFKHLFMNSNLFKTLLVFQQPEPAKTPASSVDIFGRGSARSGPRTIGTYRQDHPCAPAAVSDTAGAIGRVDYERQSTWSVGMNFGRQLQTVTKKKKKPSQATI